MEGVTIKLQKLKLGPSASNLRLWDLGFLCVQQLRLRGQNLKIIWLSKQSIFWPIPSKVGRTQVLMGYFSKVPEILVSHPPSQSGRLQRPQKLRANQYIFCKKQAQWREESPQHYQEKTIIKTLKCPSRYNWEWENAEEPQLTLTLGRKKFDFGRKYGSPIWPWTHTQEGSITRDERINMRMKRSQRIVMHGQLKGNDSDPFKCNLRCELVSVLPKGSKAYNLWLRSSYAWSPDTKALPPGTSPQKVEHIA